MNSTTSAKISLTPHILMMLCEYTFLSNKKQFSGLFFVSMEKEENRECNETNLRRKISFIYAQQNFVE